MFSQSLNGRRSSATSGIETPNRGMRSEKSMSCFLRRTADGLR
jgi:hypothetical protein